MADGLAALLNVSALRDEVARMVRAELDLLHPAVVTQRNVESIVGLPRRDYLRAARAGAFESYTSPENARLVIAKTCDVIEHVQAHPRRLAANDATELDAALARVGARRAA